MQEELVDISGILCLQVPRTLVGRSNGDVDIKLDSVGVKEVHCIFEISENQQIFITPFENALYVFLFSSESINLLSSTNADMLV